MHQLPCRGPRVGRELVAGVPHVVEVEPGRQTCLRDRGGPLHVSAIALYREFGFVDVPAPHDNLHGLLFMERSV
jgi:hypothetical protein